MYLKPLPIAILVSDPNPLSGPLDYIFSIVHCANKHATNHLCQVTSEQGYEVHILALGLRAQHADTYL